jgi:hypothetical protein
MIAMNINQKFHGGRHVRTENKVTDTVKRVRRGTIGAAHTLPERVKKEWGDDGTTVIVGNRAYSAEEMAEMFDINLDHWQAVKRITNVWAKNTQTKVWWVPKSLNILADRWEEFLEEIKGRGPRMASIAKQKNGEILEINISDAHIGSLGWAPETGEDWDTSIAIARYRRAFLYLLEQAHVRDIGRILFVVGNDLFHFDQFIKGVPTTFRGTPQDVDTRWQKLFVDVCDMLVTLIQTAVLMSDVDVLVVPGNHDTQTSFYAGQYLQAWFHNNEAVRIDNTPRRRKYYRHGKVLLGFTHGHEEKTKDLPHIMSSEVPEAWGASTVREWHIGHKHEDEVWREGATVIRRFPPLTPVDAFATERGFLAFPGARALEWSAEGELVRQHYFNARALPQHISPTHILSSEEEDS